MKRRIDEQFTIRSNDNLNLIDGISLFIDCLNDGIIKPRFITNAISQIYFAVKKLLKGEEHYINQHNIERISIFDKSCHLAEEMVKTVFLEMLVSENYEDSVQIVAKLPHKISALMETKLFHKSSENKFGWNLLDNQNQYQGHPLNMPQNLFRPVVPNLHQELLTKRIAEIYNNYLNELARPQMTYLQYLQSRNVNQQIAFQNAMQNQNVAMVAAMHYVNQCLWYHQMNQNIPQNALPNNEIDRNDAEDMKDIDENQENEDEMSNTGNRKSRVLQPLKKF